MDPPKKGERISRMQTLGISLNVMVLRRARSFTRGIGKGGPWKWRLFWALKWLRANLRSRIFPIKCKKVGTVGTSVEDPDPNLDPYVFGPHGSSPDPVVRGTDPDLDPDPSITQQKW
jgi:hypothetical protein